MSKNELRLEAISLESRQMLSSVQIYAAGGSGQENLSLKINDVEVATFENVAGDPTAREYIQLNYETAQQISASDVRVEFTNDLYDPATGLDRNVFIDRIVIDGETFQTEGPSVYSTGIYRDNGFSGPGFLKTETLNVNGSFFFSDDNTPRDPTSEYQVTFVAKGTTGDEVVELRVNDAVVKSFQLSTVNQQYQYKTTGPFDLSQIKFAFVNDLYDPGQGIDRNVVLDSLEFENLGTNQVQFFDGNSPQIFSTGTWRAEDGVVDGFGRGDTLHSNGHFSFEEVQAPADGGSLIRFTAAGQTGEEVLQLLIDGNVYYETEVPRQFQDRVGNRGFYEYQVITEDRVDLSQLRIAFVNDGVSGFGVNRNLFVNYIYVKDLETGEIQRTTAFDNSTFSTASFLPEDGLVEGFGRGNQLTGNGYFQFAESSRLVVSALGQTNEERFEVVVNGQVEAEFLSSEPTFDLFAGKKYVADFDRPVAIEDIQIRFVNDGTSSSGADRNLVVSSVELDGRIYSSETAFSTGTWLPEDGVTPGTGRGNILHTDGYFQFGAIADVGQVEQLPSARFPVLTSVQWLDANAFLTPGSAVFRAVEEDGDIKLKLNRVGGSDGRLEQTYEVLPPFGDLPVAGSVAPQLLTVVFEDDQLASTLVIPVEDNNVSDGGWIRINQVGTNFSYSVQITDAD